MNSKSFKAAVLQRLADEHVREELEQLAADAAYNTPSSYSPDSQSYPDHQIPFVDKHMDYLLNHPKINSSQYLANLRMKSRSR